MIKTRKSLLLASVFVPACFGVLAGGAGPSNPQTPSNEIKIINKTTTLKVEAEVTANNRLLIRFQNISSKDLNGYAVIVNGAMITTDISSGDRVIVPGKTDDMEVPIGSSLPDLTVLAAMFTDGSIEGDQATAASLGEWRLGLKKQLTRALLLLNTTLTAHDVDSAAALDRLESGFSSLSLESDAAKPHSAAGFRTGRNDLVFEIKDLRTRRQRNGALMQRQRLLDLKARLERRVSSL